MTGVRERIQDYLDCHPGTHFNALTRALDLAPGQVQYHVRILERRDSIVVERLYGRTHYFPTAYDATERGAIAVLRRETARDIVFCLLDCGPSRPATVVTELGVARSTLEWHLDHLLAQNLVEKRRDANNHVTLAVPDEERVLGVLEEITPSLPERMVDRFTRLVDSLLRE